MLLIFRSSPRRCSNRSTIGSHVGPYVHKSFSDSSLSWCVGRPRPHMHKSMTFTRYKVKVMEFVKFRKSYFSRSISSAVFVWSLKLTVVSDSMRPGLQLVWAQFWNFLLGKLSRSSNFAECRYLMTLKLPYFSSAWSYSQMVWHAGSPTRIVYVDMTLTQSKVKVTDLLKLRKSPRLWL